MEPFGARLQNEKVVFVMGATGTGKSKLAIDLATRFPAEIINADKLQAYRGLDVVTNKVTEKEQRGVPHHLLGVVEPDEDFTVSDFLLRTKRAAESILIRRKIPIIAGGSNSYIEALVDDHDRSFRSRYDCCFLWVDVDMHVLDSFVADRVDEMVKAGLVEEVRDMFHPCADYTRGIRRAIGVPEMDRFFRAESEVDAETRAKMLAEAIDEIKVNTSRLARCQLAKIHRLRTLSGWNIHRLDATYVFRIRGIGSVKEAWEKLVAGPAEAIVRRFLYEEAPTKATSAAAAPPAIAAAGPIPAALAAVSSR